MPRCLDVFVSIRTTRYHRLNHSIAKPQVQPFRTKSKTWDMPSSTMSRSIRRISKKFSPSSSRIYETLSNKDQNAALFLLSVPANHEDNVCYTLMALLAAHSQAPPGGVNTLGFSSSERQDAMILTVSRLREPRSPRCPMTNFVSPIPSTTVPNGTGFCLFHTPTQYLHNVSAVIRCLGQWLITHRS